VLDASEHAARRLGASVEMEYERSLGRQLEGHGTWPLIRQQSGSIALACHTADDTARGCPALWNGRQIAVRRRSERGSPQRRWMLIGS